MTNRGDVIHWDVPPASLDTIAAELRSLREAAGSPSYAEIGRLVAQRRARRGVPEHERRIPRGTIYYALQDGRRRIDVDAATEIALALGLPADRHRDFANRVSAARANSDAASVAIAHCAPPSPVGNFAGRSSELNQIMDSLRTRHGMVWISGMGGLGKTQTALSALRRLDTSVVFLDLRGFHAESPPVDAEAAQRAILRALGTDERLPSAKRERARHLARALRDADSTLILDDAAGPDPVSEILGDVRAAKVLVTSRRKPPPDDDRWLHIELQPMVRAEIADLLSPFGYGADAAAIDRLTEVSGGLPLAVSLVAGRARTLPGWTLEEHVDLIARRIESARFDSDLHSSLELSYAALPTEAARLLRAFADLPVAEIDVDDAAMALETDRKSAAEAVLQLLGSSVALARSDDAIALHSLVRVFAREKAEELDPPRLRNEAFGRVAQRLAETVWGAYQVIVEGYGDTVRNTAFAYPPLNASSDEAHEWLRRRLSAVLSLAHAAHSRGRPDLLFRISEGLSLWMNLAGFHVDALRLHETAADVAAMQHDADALAMASLDVGQLLVMSNSPDEALEHFQRATRLISDAGELSDPGLEGVLLNMSGLVQVRRGEYADAIEGLRKAAAIHESRGEHWRLLSALINLSIALNENGDHGAQAEVLEQGLQRAKELEHELLHATFLANRAALRIHTSQFDGAIADAHDVVTLAETVGSPYLVASGHRVLAMAWHARDDLATAYSHALASLTAARDNGAESPIADSLVVIADIEIARGDLHAAIRCLDEADDLVSQDADEKTRDRIDRLRTLIAEPPTL